MDVKKGVKDRERDAQMEDTRDSRSGGLESFVWRLGWY